MQQTNRITVYHKAAPQQSKQQWNKTGARISKAEHVQGGSGGGSQIISN